MKTNEKITTKNKRLLILLILPLIVLTIPLVMMQFTDEVEWSFFDFIAMSVLLFGTVLVCEFILRMFSSVRSRVILYISVIFTLILVWMELAVGILGTSFSGN